MSIEWYIFCPPLLAFQDIYIKYQGFHIIKNIKLPQGNLPVYHKDIVYDKEAFSSLVQYQKNQ